MVKQLEELTGAGGWGADLKSRSILFQSPCFFLYISLPCVSLGKSKTHIWVEVGRVSDAEQVLSKSEATIQQLLQTWVVITALITAFCLALSD